MSIALMTAAWALDLPTGEKIVMLALADNANDEGHCWPSMATIARKSGMTRRGAQLIVQRLEASGHIHREQVDGKGCNYYVHPRTSCTPEQASPVNDVRSERGSPANETADTRERRSPKPSGTFLKIKASPQSSVIDECQSVFEEWNLMAKTAGLPSAVKLDQPRRNKLKARLADHGRAAFTEAIQRVARSSHCTGNNDRGWKANFDFLLSPSSFLKVIEGNYDGKKPPGPGGDSLIDDVLRRYQN